MGPGLSGPVASRTFLCASKPYRPRHSPPGRLISSDLDTGSQSAAQRGTLGLGGYSTARCNADT